MPSLLFPLLAIALKSVLHSSSPPDGITARTGAPLESIDVGIGVTRGVVSGDATTELHADSACCTCISYIFFIGLIAFGATSFADCSGLVTNVRIGCGARTSPVLFDSII